MDHSFDLLLVNLGFVKRVYADVKIWRINLKFFIFFNLYEYNRIETGY